MPTDTLTTLWMSVAFHSKVCVYCWLIPGQSMWDLWCGQCGTGAGFSLSTSVFQCLYHAINTPYSYFIHLLPQLLVHNTALLNKKRDSLIQSIYMTPKCVTKTTKLFQCLSTMPQSCLDSWCSHFAILHLTHWIEDWVHTTAFSRCPKTTASIWIIVVQPTAHLLIEWATDTLNRWPYICTTQQCKALSIRKYLLRNM